MSVRSESIKPYQYDPVNSPHLKLADDLQRKYPWQDWYTQFELNINAARKLYDEENDLIDKAAYPKVSELEKKRMVWEQRLQGYDLKQRKISRIAEALDHDLIRLRDRSITSNVFEYGRGVNKEAADALQADYLLLRSKVDPLEENLKRMKAIYEKAITEIDWIRTHPHERALQTLNHKRVGKEKATPFSTLLDQGLRHLPNPLSFFTSIAPSSSPHQQGFSNSRNARVSSSDSKEELSFSPPLTPRLEIEEEEESDPEDLGPASAPFNLGQQALSSSFVPAPQSPSILSAAAPLLSLLGSPSTFGSPPLQPLSSASSTAPQLALVPPSKSSRSESLVAQSQQDASLQPSSSDSPPDLVPPSKSPRSGSPVDQSQQEASLQPSSSDSPPDLERKDAAASKNPSPKNESTTAPGPAAAKQHKKKKKK